MNNKGIPSLQPLVDDDTPTDLDFESYYSQREIENLRTELFGKDFKGSLTNNNSNDETKQNNKTFIEGENDHSVDDGGIGPMNYPLGGNQGMGNDINMNNPHGAANGFLNRINPFRFIQNSWPFIYFFEDKKHPEDYYPKESVESELEEPPHMKRLKEQARKFNNSGLYVNIANLYLIGNSDIGLNSNKEKAWKYYKIAADMNNSAAIHNVAVNEMNNNLSYSLELFQR